MILSRLARRQARITIRSYRQRGLLPTQHSQRPQWRLLSSVSYPDKVARAELGGWDADDTQLRVMFDHPQQDPSLSSTCGENLGLFRNRYLTCPEGFRNYATLSVARAKRVAESILSASQGYARIVVDMDRVSDLLCRLLDLCEFVRMMHSDRRFQEAAGEAWASAYDYMVELNSDPRLSKLLSHAIADREIFKNWSHEEKMSALQLNSDFMKSAVMLPEKVRVQVMQTVQEIRTASNLWVDSMAPGSAVVRFPAAIKNKSRWATVNDGIHVFSSEASQGLTLVDDDDVRKHLLYGQRTASQRTVARLNEMLRLRSKLARLVGYKTYAQMVLRDKTLANEPENVFEFLHGIAAYNSDQAAKEVALLLEEKRRHVAEAARDATSPKALEDVQLMPWDEQFYISRFAAQEASRGPYADTSLHQYFSIGSVIRGLSRLFSRLYGVRFVPATLAPGEAWAPEVRKLHVISDTEGHVAVLYCDLFHRANKNTSTAHHTIRCSRAILPEELEEFASGLATAALTAEQKPRFATLDEAANDGMATSRTDGTLWQLPTVVLACNFTRQKSDWWKSGGGKSASSSAVALLSLEEVQTLFHEMGHAMHSILARTRLQNVAGTRVPTDLAELPSTLLERFATSDAVLALYANHHVTGEPIPPQLVRQHAAADQRFAGLSMERQIIWAMVDQQLAAVTPDPVSDTVDSTRIYLDLLHRCSHLPPDPPGTCAQAFFAHLNGYGAVYYSYMFDRVLAERVWNVVFGDGAQALDRDAGERFKQGLLKWGGSVDGWHLLATTLRDEKIRDGGAEAMRIVGSWALGPVLPTTA